VVGGVDERLDALVPVSVRLVVHPPAALVLHHAALVVELLLRHRRKQEPHAVGLEPERELQPVRRNGLEIVGAVQPGGAVHGAAYPLDVGDVLRVGHVLRALEHHVLEEVREAGPPRPLVTASDVVPEVDGHHRLAVVLGEDDPEAVIEGVGLDGDVHAVRFACEEGDEEAQDLARVQFPSHPETGSQPWDRNARGRMKLSRRMWRHSRSCEPPMGLVRVGEL
jgi:hypothetical protein